MKLNLNEFLPKLALANMVVNPKPIIAAQGDFLLKTDDGCLFVNASDGENTVSVRVKPTEFSELNICVNANDFFKALSNLRGEDIEIILNTEKHLVRCMYKSGYFQLPYSDNADEAYLLEIQPEEYHIERAIDSADLAEAIAKAEIAASENTLKPLLCGVYFDFKQDGMVVVASDASKMSKFKTTIKSDADTRGFIIQKKGAHILTSLITDSDNDTVNMRVGDKSVLFTNDGFILTSRLTEGDYPDYNTLIPETTVCCATINKDVMLNAIKRVSPMCNEKDEMVKMSFGEGFVIIEAEDVYLAKLAKEKVECKYTGEKMTIGINSHDMVTLLQAMDCDDVDVRFNNPKNPLLLLPKSDLSERFTTLTMPLMFRNV